MFDNFKCQFLDTWESGTISFDFCSQYYSSCSKRCRDYGECYICEHNKDPVAFCANCLFSSSDVLSSDSIHCQNSQK